MDETGRRRLAVLYSHLLPSSLIDSCNNTQIVSSLNCSSQSPNEDLKENPVRNSQQDCIFCQIIRGHSPAFKLYEDDTCVCILDTSPLSRGHSLLIPKLHYRSLDVTPPSVIASMCSKVPFISNAIKKVTGCDSFNVLVNNGAAAGQVIFHTHIHIIPRKARDCLWASESLRRLSLKLDQEASQLAESIREQISAASSNTENHKSEGSSLSVNDRV